jgi:diguanylate cyclase (GGDEF)-like protein/PAS domain S-box-containing protein
VVDARHRHGVWITGLSNPDAEDDHQAPGTAVSGALAVPLRPRTATVRKSVLAMIIGIDDRTTRMLGWTPDQMIGSRSSDFVHPDDQERAVANWLELLAKKETVRVRLRQQCSDGSWLWVEIENVYQPGEDGEEAMVLAQMSDISDEMAVHEALDRRERLLHRLAESLPTGIVQLASDRSVVYANSRLGNLLGLPHIAGIDDLLTAVLAADRPALEAALTGALQDDADADLEVQIQRHVHDVRICAVSLISLSNREGAPGALLCLDDITDSARMREELKVKATYDALTGCHNRSSILTTLDNALRSDVDSLTAVVFVDLDEFKAVNDTYGHAAGDELLLQAASRLTSMLRRDDAVGRLGGDEFLLVSRGLESVDDALALAERVREALHQPVDLGIASVDLCASIGVACSVPGDPAGGMDGSELTRQADLAMYESKQLRRGQVVLYRTPETVS